MSSILETNDFPVSIPDLPEICLLSSSELWDRLSGWETAGGKGVDIVARAVALFSRRRVLEDKGHPWKPRFKIKAIKDCQAEFSEIVNKTEELLPNRKTYPYRSEYRAALFRVMRDFFKGFLTDDVRSVTVSQHARNMSTGNVARYLLSPECEKMSVFYHLVKYEPHFESGVVEWLTPRLAYLKVGTPSFPVKYRELWRSERAAFLEEIKDVPLTNTSEQVKALSDLYRRLDDAFEASETDRGKAQLSASMVKCLSGLYSLTRSFSPPQDAIEENQ